MRFTTFVPCAGSASFCGVRILAQGVIQRDSGQIFLQFLSNTKAHIFPLPPRPTVVFDSAGGNILGALDLGRAIRRSRMDTEAGTSYSRVKPGNIFEEEAIVDSPVCASACVLAFAGGLTRTVQAGAKLGIHQFSAIGRAIGDSATQITVVALASYFEEMGVDRQILDRASLVSPSSILWLSQSETRSFRLDNGGPGLAPWRITATSQGDAILEVVQPISEGRSVYLRLGSIQGQIVLSTTAVLSKSAYRSDRLAQFPVGEPAEILICSERSCFQGKAIRAWDRRDTESHVQFKSIVTLTISELRALSTANALSIRDNFGTATSDVSLATGLSVSGFSGGVSLLIRQRN